MIRTFADKRTAAIFAGMEVRRLLRDLQQRAAERLTLIDAAHVLDDLRVPPGKRLERLAGDRTGQCSIHINDQWRICFQFEDGDAFDVKIVDH